MSSIQAQFYAQLEAAPDRRALTFIDAHGDFSWSTLEEVHERASAYSAALADLGLGHGDVCILVQPSDEFCATMLLAVLLRGAVPLLMAPPTIQGVNSNLAEVLQRIIRRTKARMVVAPEEMAGERERFAAGSARTRFIFGEKALSPDPSAVLPTVTPAETDIAAMQLTSGTTGFPRVCMWKHSGVLASLEAMDAAMKIGADDVCLNWTPLYHDMGLVNNFLFCFTRGVPLAMMKPQHFVKRPALWLRGLSDTGATITWSPNFGFVLAAQRIKDADIEGVRLDGVRAFWNAAERIHLDSILAFHERFASYGVRLEAMKTNFGCAENVGGATFSDPDGLFVYERVDRALLQVGIAQPVEESSENGHSVAVVSAGRPAPGIRVAILSRTGDPLPEGHVGEVALETPSRLVGYLHDARATRRALFGKLLRTGDVGYVRNGELFWTGRVRERISVRGRKLDPSDFEPILLKVPGLRHGCFAAFGVDDDKNGTQRIVIVAEVRDDATENHDDIRGAIRDQAFSHLGMDISEVLLVRQGTLTKTSSGKRRHRHFRQLYLDGKIDAFEGALPASDTVPHSMVG